MKWAEYVRKELYSLGVPEEMADKIFTVARATPGFDPMQGRWDTDVQEYPPTMSKIVMQFVFRTAKLWLADNAPEAWFRPLFD